jgi:hypothetical protein
VDNTAGFATATGPQDALVAVEPEPPEPEPEPEDVDGAEVDVFGGPPLSPVAADELDEPASADAPEVTESDFFDSTGVSLLLVERLSLR